MKPEPRVFVKPDRCTKADIWRCFRRQRGFVHVQVDIAHSIIGLNAPRVMERNGYVVKEKTSSGDFYRLTDPGEAWLVAGVMAYMHNHPAENIPFSPRENIPAARRVRRVRQV